MTDKEEVTKIDASEKSPFRAMRESIERVLEAGKKAVNAAAGSVSSSSSSSSSSSGSDSDMDPDINISLNTSDKQEEKVQEDNSPHMSLAEALRIKNETFEKEVTDAVRVKQQKEAVERSEILAKTAAAELGTISGCSGSKGPEIDF